MLAIPAIALLTCPRYGYHTVHVGSGQALPLLLIARELCAVPGSLFPCNFLYSLKVASARSGAARAYPKAFVDDYLRMVRACADRDNAEVLLRSTRMGFLTGTCLSAPLK